MIIKNETSKSLEVIYYGNGAVIEAGQTFEIVTERIGDSITLRSEEGEISLFRKFDSRIVAEIGSLKASVGKFPMEVIIHS